MNSRAEKSTGQRGDRQGTHRSAENARSSSRDDGLAVSQSKEPTSRSPSITALYGAASWWPTIHPGCIVRPVNHRSSFGGVKTAVASWMRRIHWPTCARVESAYAQAGQELLSPITSPGR
jgi:hypothetical protein